MIRRLALSGTLLAVLAAPAWCQGPPRHEMHPMLKKVAGAMANYKFTGERSVLMPQRDGAIKFTERIWRDKLSIRSEFRGDSRFNGQIIVESKDRRLHLIPSLKIVRESAPRQDEALNFILGTSGSAPGVSHGSQRRGGRGEGQNNGERKLEIKFSESDGGKIAGYGTRLLQMTGQDGRVFQKFWIEPKRSFIMKHSALDSNGKEWGGFEYKRVQFNPSIDNSLFSLKIPSGYKLVTLLDDLKAHAEKLSLKPYRIQGASGYKLVGVRAISEQKTKVLTQTYTNGKNRLTFYQIKGEFNTDRFKSAAGGRFNVHVWSADGVRFLLMGEFSENDLKSLADKVKA